MNERISKYIDSNGMIRKFVAEKSGIDSKKFYRLMSGKTPMTIDEYELICKDGLAVDPAYFFKNDFSKNEKFAKSAI